MQFLCDTVLIGRLGYRHDIREWSKDLDEETAQNLCPVYYELEQLIEANFPAIENALLKRYLVFVAYHVVLLFLNDCSKFLLRQAENFRGVRVFTDSVDYCRNQEEMRLIRFKSFVLPKVFSDEKIEEFVCCYNI